VPLDSALHDPSGFRLFLHPRKILKATDNNAQAASCSDRGAHQHDALLPISEEVSEHNANAENADEKEDFLVSSHALAHI
jgi:hypothetical protein